MNQNKPAVVKKLQERFRNVSVGRGLYIAFVMPTMLSMFSTRAFAADTIWTKSSAIMQDVYANPQHQHHCRSCYGCRCASSDELLQIRTDG